METVKYTPDLKVANIEALPAGLGCRYLIAIEAHTGILIAKAWKRKQPTSLKPGEVLITF